MPITFNVANKPLEKAEEKAGRRAQNAADAAPSIAGSPLPEGAVAAHNGFVDTIVKAYNNHHHLILRPDDVWIAIITQFSAYMEKYAEALRDKFVSHQGQIELEVRSSGTLFSAPYEAMALKMTELIADKLKDPSVRDWVLPKFSTTTPTDTTVGAIALMASMKAYFQYKFSLCCGIPKVTLEGTVEDWEQIEARAARLLEFDNDKGFMRIWYHMLKDVLAHFTLSAKGTPNIDWWQRVCSHLGGGSGPRYLSGWVTVFCVFSDQGDWQGDRRKAHSMSRELSFIDKEFAPEGWPVIDTNDLPSGECKAPVLVDDNGTKYDCMLIAGHKHIKAEGTSLQPWVSWRLVEQKNLPKPKDPREHF